MAMDSDPIISTLAGLRLVPVIVCDEPSRAAALADALVAGGLPVAEITLRTANALEAIHAVRERSDLLLGAGTVLSADQAAEAIDSGARFVVSPGLDEGVVETCRQRGVPVIPGVSTASEVQRAANLGLKVVKFFPAEAIGGLKLLNALSAPFPAMRFVPTGGIGPNNVLDYLNTSAVIACGGSWMVKRDWIQAGKWEELTACVREAVALAQTVKTNS